MLTRSKSINDTLTWASGLLRREFASRSDGHHPRLHPADIIPVTVPLAEAKQRFYEFHRSNLLAPNDLLGPDDQHQIRLAYLPFWAFSAAVTTQFSASVGHKQEGTVPHTKWTRSSVHVHQHTLDRWQRLTQIYGSYHDRRDLAEGLKAVIQEHADHFVPLSSVRTRAGGRGQDVFREMALGQEVQVQPLEMRQSIAWELAYRAIRLAEEERAMEELKREYGADSVRDLHLEVRTHHRSAAVLLVPAYIITYHYGVHQYGTLDIVRQRHQALVPATRSPPPEATASARGGARSARAHAGGESARPHGRGGAAHASASSPGGASSSRSGASSSRGAAESQSAAGSEGAAAGEPASAAGDSAAHRAGSGLWGRGSLLAELPGMAAYWAKRLLRAGPAAGFVSWGKTAESRGERRGERAERSPQGGAVSGGGARVISERHFSPLKAQGATVAAAVVVSYACGAVGAAVGGTPLTGVEAAFYTFLAASAAGVAARGYTGYVRDRHLGSLDGRTAAIGERYLQGGMSAANVSTAHHAWLRTDAEWMRWEEADKWDWDRDKRRAWAERLWEEHHTRRLRKKFAARQAAEEHAKHEAYAAKEAARQARFGRSTRAHNVFSGGASRASSGRLDIKGYYKLMGLEKAPKAEVSAAHIKKAYREAAMRLHPDRMSHRAKHEQAKASVDFQELQRAYDVLRDPEQRKLYDAGTMPRPQ